MKKRRVSWMTLAVLVAGIILIGSSAIAEIPKLISYQGFVTDNLGNPASGSHNLTFRIYDNSKGGTLLWTEAQTGVQVESGLFNVLLGQVTALNLPFDKPYWLELQVGAETMSRLSISSVGYAYRALVADSARVAGSGGGGGGGWVDDGTAVRLETTTDSVGIGTSSPIDPLHVVGDVHIDGDLHVDGTLRGHSPLNVEDGIAFMNSTGALAYHIELDEPGEHEDTGMPDAMHGALGIESFLCANPYDMAVVFWDGGEDRPIFILNEGMSQRASTFEHSVQVGKVMGAVVVDSNYTKIE